MGGDGGPSRKDDAVPTRVAAIENVAVEKVDTILEKGTLEFNGKDTVITSWTVLSNRNPGKTKAELESVLKDRFGISKVVWISGSSPTDLTDGHVDGIARFINENTVLAVINYMNRSRSQVAVESSIDNESDCFDLNGDGRVTAIEALMVINHLRS